MYLRWHESESYAALRLCRTAECRSGEFRHSAMRVGLGDKAFVVMGRQEKAQTPLAIGIAYKVSWAE